MADVDDGHWFLPDPMNVWENDEVAEAAFREEEKRRQEEEKRREEARRARHKKCLAEISEYDPKMRRYAYTRFYLPDMSDFDLDEESQLGPMRYTDEINGPSDFLSGSVNLFSVKIVESDVGYPINLYGTIIARDTLDRKCIYIFRRDRENCQLINSKDESLTLTGPTRGLLLCDPIFVETNLKIKGDRRSKDKALNKGLLELEGHNCKFYKVKQLTFLSKLSMVELTYSAHRNAVEATVEIKITNGLSAFDGMVTARTSKIQADFLLYDSKKGGAITVGDDGTVRLLRRVVAVSVHERLEFYIDAFADGQVYGRKIDFTPNVRGRVNHDLICGVYKMQVTVAWSALYDWL